VGQRGRKKKRARTRDFGAVSGIKGKQEGANEDEKILERVQGISSAPGTVGGGLESFKQNLGV